MWLRINYFPLLLSIFVGVSLDLLYIVPLHTTAFFITMVTCYVAKLCATHLRMNHWQKNCTAMALCFVIHVLFYETPCARLLEYFFGHEIFFRFTSDKYSAVLGIISGYFWHHAQSFVTWANTPISSPPADNISITPTLPTSEATSESTHSRYGEQECGLCAAIHHRTMDREMWTSCHWYYHDFILVADVWAYQR
jgi:hypothetical protein